MAFLTAKTIAIILGLAAVGLCASTIVIAVQKANVEQELEDARNKIEELESATTTQGTTTSSTINPSSSTDQTSPSTGQTSPSTGQTSPSTGPTDPSNPSTPSTETTHTISTSTGNPGSVTPPQENPNYPTLPPGLITPENVTYRLPTDLRPIKYRIHWHPDFETMTFEGAVSIQVEVDKATNMIVFHSKNLELSGITVLNMMARMRMLIRKITIDDEKEMVFIEMDELLRTTTPYVVSVGFTGSLDSLHGVYASSYTDEKGLKRWLATTKFEPTHARQAFPCFDEPAMKATFIITVVRPSGDNYHALSNVNIFSEERMPDTDLIETMFEQSETMSTYLVCFIISDFVSQTRTVRGTLENAKDFPMSVYSTKTNRDKLSYALDVGVSITEFYIDYFQIPYPLPKLDMAAIPDFASGAMENWGLVTYRETNLIYDPEISSSANKQRVATVIAHELAHMWFGNLVTMKWWNDLWLNEGFASYIEYKGVNHVHPEWEMESQFLVQDMHGVMNLDATLASHPIVQTVENPNQITELFDSITYSKGASIIRMLENLVGPEKFRNATTNYLWHHYFSNAETDDYFTEVEALNFDFDVKQIMETWTLQMGLPVVEVTRTGNIYKLTQKRFFSNPEDYNGTYTDSRFNYRWSIPITYFTNTDATISRLIFNYDDNEPSFTVLGSVQWIKLNKDQVGYYRVNYPIDHWKAMTTALQTNLGAFSTADRAHLLDDVFTLAGAGQVPYEIALDMSTYLRSELDYLPWNTAISQLGAIRNTLYYTDLYRDFIVYGRSMIDNVYNSVGWAVGSDHLENLLRVDALNAACAYGHPDALQKVGELFNNWLNNPSSRPSPDVRSIVYNYGMKESGNEERWNKVWALYLAETDAQEKAKLMASLSHIREPWILQRYITMAWSEPLVRRQDYFTVLQQISMNRVGQSLVWDHVRENWPALVTRFTLNDRQLGRLIPAITSGFTTQTKLEEVEAFFAKYPEAGAGNTGRKEALADVRYNIQWLKDNRQQIADWLSNQVTTTSAPATTTTTTTNTVTPPAAPTSTTISPPPTAPTLNPPISTISSTSETTTSTEGNRVQ